MSMRMMNDLAKNWQVRGSWKEEKEEIVNICDSLNYPFCSELISLLKDLESFEKEYNECMAEEKAIVSVVGVVKAGKSSFLNCLLFDGKELLPKAVTPMTAALVVIESGRKNEAEVIYFSEKEFRLLESEIRKNGSEEEKSLLPSLRRLLLEKLAERKGREIIVADNGEELLRKLSNFVSSEKEISYIVKEINVKVDIPGLGGLKVVDTPGLNDPVYSRSEKTRDYIKKSHVVFYLSRTSQFLESEDVYILKRFLEESVQELYLVGSRYDETLKELRFQGERRKVEPKGDWKKLISEKLKGLRKGKENTLQPESVDKYIDILREKCQKRIWEVLGNRYYLSDFSLFSALFFKAGNGMLDTDEEEIFNKFVEDTRFIFNRSWVDYSGISVLRNKIEEVKRKHKEMVEKKKKEFVLKRKSSVDKRVNSISYSIREFLAENENSIEILNRVIENLKENMEKFSSELEKRFLYVDSKYQSILDSAIRHMEEGLRNLRPSIGVRHERRTKIVYDKKRVTRWCIFENEVRIPREEVYVEEIPYLDVDKSIKRARNLILKAVRTYRAKARYEIGNIRERLKRESELLIDKLVDEAFEEFKRENNKEFKNLYKNISKLKKTIKREIKAAIAKINFPDPINIDMKFLEYKFREVLKNIDVNDADYVYKTLLREVLLEIKRKVEIKGKQFSVEIRDLISEISRVIIKAVDGYYESVRDFLSRKEKVKYKLERLSQLVFDLQREFDEKVRLLINQSGKDEKHEE